MKSNDVEAKVESQEIKIYNIEGSLIVYIAMSIRMKGKFLYSKFKAS